MKREQLTLFPLQVAPKPKRSTVEDLADEWCDRIIEKCRAEGVDSTAVLLELKRREVQLFLEQFAPNQQKQFALRLLVAVEKKNNETDLPSPQQNHAAE